MMRNILKYLVIAAAVAQGAWAAGTWELVTNAWYDTTQPPTIKLRDCSVDSKGVLWYFVDNRNGLGIHSYNPTTKVTTNYSSNFKGYVQGMYLNRATDSLYVGADTGRVYSGKNGVFHELPKIPLLYYYDDGYSNTMMSRVYDLIHDSQGRLIAATDSLAWWLDGGSWKPIGSYDQYGEPDLDGTIYDLQKDKNGMIFWGGGTMDMKYQGLHPVCRFSNHQ